MTASAVRVQELLRQACGSQTDIVDIEDSGQVVAVDVDRSEEEEAIERSTAALIETGWTVYAREWFDTPVEVLDRIQKRHDVHRLQPFLPPDRCAPTDWTVDSVLAAADCLSDRDIDNQLARIERERNDIWRDHTELELSVQLSSTRNRYGTAPDRSEIPRAAQQTPVALDRWLLGWEQRQGSREVGYEFPDWILGVGNGVRVVAIPWNRPEAVLAADMFHGAPTVLAVALLKRWHDCYGTRVVVHSGSGLALRSDRLPQTVDEAHGVAREIDLLANDLLGGGGPAQARRAYAYGLMTHHRWWLWGRL